MGHSTDGFSKGASTRTRIVGGVSVVSFLTAKHLTEDGLRAVVEGLTR
jgi:hypothetical protein